MPLYFHRDGRLAFCGDRPIFVEADCTGCRCCGSQLLNPRYGFNGDFGQCRFNRNAKIKHYQYFYYIGGTLVNSFLAVKDFDKIPAFKSEGGASCGGRGGSCSFCQQYWFRRYDIDLNVIDGPRLLSGGGEADGFVYTPRGWWDGNEAAKRPENENPPSKTVAVVPGAAGSSGRSGTYFACGHCHGWIRIRYYYADVLGAYADVSFYVDNEDCKDTGVEQSPYDFQDGWEPPPAGVDQLPYN